MSKRPEVSIEYLCDKFKLGEISNDELGKELDRLLNPAKPQDLDSKLKPSEYFSPGDLIRDGWIPTQHELGILVGRRPEGQQATLDDLLGMEVIDISTLPQRLSLVRARFLNSFGAPLSPEFPLRDTLLRPPAQILDTIGIVPTAN